MERKVVGRISTRLLAKIAIARFDFKNGEQTAQAY
jgi:hypothetical protein